MDDQPISHALVIPDQNFEQWLDATRAYTRHFERVAILRSPRGNDLNRYRDITAVEAPNVWIQNNALAHIRRIYPLVVRVDVIKARTPNQLQDVLKQRIVDNDRYGERNRQPEHIFDRFVIQYPSNHRPMRILIPFDHPANAEKQNRGIDIATRPGANILAAAPGTVARVVARDSDRPSDSPGYLEITSRHEDLEYAITYEGLQNIAVTEKTQVKIGDVLGKATSDRLRIIVRQKQGNNSKIVDPGQLLYIAGFRVFSTVNRLRIRSLPDIESAIIGHTDLWELLETLEPQGRTLAKIGTESKWVRVKMPTGKPGYTAAWFLQAASTLDPPPVLSGVNPIGINLDQLHPLGAPAPARLGKIGWVRLGYNVSNLTGSTDIRAAYDRYRPIAEKYAKSGYKVMFVTSHQTFGEGRDEFFDANRRRWMRPEDGRWIDLTNRFVDMLERIAAQWAKTGLVHAWQIWNEQDAPEGAEASVPISSFHYANMLTKSIQAIKAAHPEVFVITGGHTGGPGKGASYARQTLSFMPSGLRPDGIAFHPYGRGTKDNDPFGHFGHIDESIQAYGGIMPSKPLWITEWGVLNAWFVPSSQIAEYAVGFINHLKRKYPGKIATMIWFAWADTMHNGYGLVDQENQPKPTLYETFINA